MFKIYNNIYVYKVTEFYKLCVKCTFTVFEELFSNQVLVPMNTSNCWGYFIASKLRFKLWF